MGHWDYECPYCDPDTTDPYPLFFSVADMAEHRDEVHPGKRIYVCSACEKTFQEWQKATEHVFDAHDEYCDECQSGYIYEAVFLSPEVTKRRDEIHTEINNLKKELDVICSFPTVQTSGDKTQ